MCLAHAHVISKHTRRPHRILRTRRRDTCRDLLKQGSSRLEGKHNLKILNPMDRLRAELPNSQLSGSNFDGAGNPR